VKALREIRHCQETTKLLLRKRPFQRLVREILNSGSIAKGQSYMVQTMALKALQHATEAYITELFEHSNLATVHQKRVTLFPRDIRLVQRLNDAFDFV